MLFAHSTSPLPQVLASQDTSHQTSRAYAPLRRQSSLPGLRAVDGLCLEVSLGTRGPDPVLYQLFAIQSRKSFPIRTKMIQKWVRLLRPKRDLQTTDHLWPSNLGARTVSLVEHTHSNFGADPCLVRRGLAAAVKCYVRKARFFLGRQRTEMIHHYRRHCSRVPVR